MDTNPLKKCLDEVITYLEERRVSHDESGDNYNIFQVIHMTSNETSVHSAFLADMLSPDGRHHTGGTFLRLFIEMLSDEQKLKLGDFDVDNARVSVEFYIGKMTEYTGGRLDIIVSSVINGIEKAVIIENKIRADDQNNQMIRYYNYAEEHYQGNYLLLYLSPDGSVHDLEKTAHSTKIDLKENEQFHTISYESFIRGWLMKCLDTVPDKPLISSAITHYYNLLGFLTGQSITMEERKKSACIIAEQYPALIRQLELTIEQSKIELHRRFWHLLVEKLAEDEELTGYPVGFWSVESTDEESVSNENVLEQIDKRVDKYKWGKNHKQFGISLKIGNQQNWNLYFVISVNYNLLFQVSASNKGNHNLNQNGNIPEKYKEIRNRNMPNGWTKADYRLWGTYPGDGLKLNFGNPSQNLYSWFDNLEHNMDDTIIGSIRKNIGEIKEILK